MGTTDGGGKPQSKDAKWGEEGREGKEQEGRGGREAGEGRERARAPRGWRRRVVLRRTVSSRTHVRS